MCYEQFLDYVRENIIKILGDDYRVSVHKVLKNNDIELDALTVTEADSYISPTIYLNQYFREYEEGGDIGGIVNDIYKLYEEHRGKMEFDLDYFKDFNKVKDKIAFKLINAVQNVKLLEDVPYIPLLDLAIVFYCLVDNDNIGSATALIHQSHLDIWGIDVTQLYKSALNTTPKILKYELRNMNDIIKEMLINDLINNRQSIDGLSDESYNQNNIDEFVNNMIRDMQGERDNIQMYVLTNQQKINGAACILYKDVLQEFALRENEDLYILPSSIHEVIIVPAINEISRDQLNSMVREVNKEEVEVGDVLSDHVYIYRKDIDQICM